MRFPCSLLLCLFLSVSVAGAEVVETDAEPGILTKLVWYIPNRIIDLVDIVRFRVGVGPGVEAGARITDVGSLYAGNSRSVWIGLPGERGAGEFPRLAGATQKRGLTLLGTDATDVMPDPPRYDFSEIGVQLHLGVAGVEAGIVPTEVMDFLWGIIGRDVTGDDLPRRGAPVPRGPGRVLEIDHMNRTYPLQARPDRFRGTGERLDYLEVNVPVRMRGYMHSTDRAFVNEEDWVYDQPPVTDLEIGLWYEYISSPTASSDFDQKFRLDVELPNLERNLSLFIDNDLNDRLPGTDLADQENTGVSVGLRRQLEKYRISSDIGIKTRWPPEAFARVRWRPEWNWGDTRLGFEQRLFWENEDGFGTLTQLNAFRWLGVGHHWLFRNVSAGRFTENTEGLEWQQTFTLGHMTRLVEEERRLDNLGPNDTLRCFALNASVFGEDRLLDKYRFTALKRMPIYKDFVLVEMEPGLEWRNENDWETQYRFDVGMVLLF